MFYDFETRGFYAPGMQPEGAHPLTKERHAELCDALASGKVMALVGGEIKAVDPDIPAITPAMLRESVTGYRWKIETAGITLPDGIKVATSIDDQNRITTVVANARMAGLESVKFKAASGWITLSVAELEGVAAAVARHVQACFAAECEHHQAIDAIALIPGQAERQAALESYDVSKGWPEN